LEQKQWGELVKVDKNYGWCWIWTEKAR